MRDINRIDEYLETVKKVWKKYPDWRFGQLVSNVIGDSPFAFYVEDDRSIKAFEAFLEEK